MAPKKKAQPKKVKPRLSKSQYIKGRQCELALWLQHGNGKEPLAARIANDKADKKSPAQSQRQLTFQIGNKIGAIAQTYFAQNGEQGVEITFPFWNPSEGIRHTADYVAAGEDLLFEATVINPTDGTYSSIDILRKVPGTADEWDLIEVKSAPKVKPYHLEDIAFQYHVFAGAGYKIRNCYIMHVNQNYVLRGELDPQGLLQMEDVTSNVTNERKQAEVKRTAALLIKKKYKQNEPKREIGVHCSRPFNCASKARCWKHVPLYSIFNTHSAAEVSRLAKQNDSYDIKDVAEEDFPANPRKNIDTQCYIENKAHIKADKVAEFIDDLEYPLYYVDYEFTFSAVPFYQGTKPQQEIPFQFSLHIQDKPGSTLRHVDFLHCERTDPRRAFAEKLIKECGQKGSVIVYHQGAEGKLNSQLAKEFPDLATDLEAINDRMADLLIPFRNRWLYHPDQNGSASLKNVLPAWTNVSYDHLNMKDGAQALATYLDFLNSNDDPADYAQIWDDLRKYCKQDTYAMVALIETMTAIKEGVVSIPTIHLKQTQTPK
jgi:hypothetical protein